MGKAERYDDSIFRLGYLARDRLADWPCYPRAMERVFRAEDAVVARRDELAWLEQQLDEEDAAYQESLARQAEERPAGAHRRAVGCWRRCT